MKNLQTYLILIGVMVAWGLNVPTLKILVSHVMPVTITSVRVFSAGLFVFLVLAIMKKVRMPTKKEWKYIIFGGLLNVVCHHYFLSIGLKNTSATNGGLILGTGPILTAIMATIILRQKPTRMKAIGFILGGVGVYLTILSSGNGFSGLSMGDVSVFLSIVTQALSFIIISKAAKTLDPRLLTGYMLVFGSIILFIISLIKEPGALAQMSDLPASIWGAFFASGLIATALGHMMYNYSISIVGAAEAAIFLNLNTFFSLVGSALLLGESITSHHILGLVFIVSGVLFGSGTLEELMYRRRRTAIEK